ncbi:MAG TPA: 16S rRNA (guanine(527)-N(7))-methyltransferase RsmG [Actinomycetota bacterium]|nr:16S rRNA (guanine(527)-N(7))-methyltransferase RsmG [Actinomycetota bacterium]
MKRIVTDAATLGIELSPHQARLIRRYETLLLERAIPMGLVARSDSDRLYERHILDSLRAAPLFRPSDRRAYDLGSGAGLPGISLAIVLPRCRFTLAESRSKRSAFLELAVERLGLSNVDVHAGSADTLPAGADIVTARAFAPLERTWPLAAGLLRVGGKLIYFAGKRIRDPEGMARAAAGPSRQVSIEKVLESMAPLVMMTLE